MAKDDKHEDEARPTEATALFALVEALLELAEAHAAHNPMHATAGAWKNLAAGAAELLGDDERAAKYRAKPTPSPYSYGDAPRFMPPGPEPTPGVPQSARDDEKRRKHEEAKAKNLDRK